MIPIMISIFLFTEDTINLSLSDALEYAYTNNAELKQMEINVSKATADIGVARSSFYPTISATGYYAYLSDVPLFQMDSSYIPMGQHENYNFQVSLQQVLFSWGKLYDAYRLANLNQDLARLKCIRKKQEVKNSVTKMFYDILVLSKTIELTNESYNQLKRHEEAVRKRYEAGLVSQFDLLRAQVQLANLKPALIQAENGLKLTREAFKMIVGMPLDNEFRLNGELEMIEEVYDLDTLIAVALENRVEIKNLRKIEKLAGISKSLLLRSNLPTLFAGVTYDRKKPFGFGGNDWGSNITFSIGFQFPIFSGYKNLYEYRKAELALKEANLAYENLKKGIILEVKQDYLKWLATKEALLAAQENVNQANKAFEIIENRYKNGLATNLEYLDTQLAVMQAKTNYLNALKDYHNARADIAFAIGLED